MTSKKKGKKKKNARLHLLNERFGRLVYFWHQNFVDNVDDTVCVHHICFDDGGFLYLKKKKGKIGNNITHINLSIWLMELLEELFQSGEC